MSDTPEFISADAKVDLDNCDREPIHIPGRIQSFGFLLAMNAEGEVVRASGTAATLLGRDLDRIIGADAKTLLGDAVMRAISERLHLLQPDEGVERLFGLVPDGLEARFDFAVHRTGALIIIEGEPSADTGMDAAAAVSRMTARLARSRTLADLSQGAARHLRALTGFDRVMVYRFAQDGSGEVIAEAARSDLPSYLGLHYPASDIPAQARVLYKRNLLRIIPDVASEPSAIAPDSLYEGEPIDLSHSVLRAVSPIHIEYLQNIGIDASMSVSILRGGELWGLFACHHMSPHRVPYDVRTAAELFGQIFSYMLETRAQAEVTAHENQARRIHAKMMQSLADGSSALENMAQALDDMTDLLGASGAVSSIGGEMLTHGETPPKEAITPLIRFLNEAAPRETYVNDRLGEAYAPARDWLPAIAGLLAIPLSRSGDDYLIFFREEAARTVNWAGDPTKVAVVGKEGGRLSPRRSFDLWKEVVRGRSAPWTEFDQTIAESLRVSLLEVILQLTGAAAQARKEAQQRQELLIAELNHRVKNILALIRGLVAQSREAARDVNSFAEVIGARIQALARAHDQLTLSSWGPRPLKGLIASEAEAYFGEKSDRIVLDGPDVLIKPEAFAAMALVIHELATNSAKYGALADSSGEVSVKWRLLDSGALEVRWGEAGGPPVKPPTRKGFGTTIVERVVPHDLNGEAEIEYALAGVRARFLIPSKHVEGLGGPDDGAAETQKQAASKGDSATANVDIGQLGRVLLVEDNLIIALDAEDYLKQMGAESVDMASSVREALRMIDDTPPDIAVLDVNLGSETSFKIADRLAGLGKPYLFATGYGDSMELPELHVGAPIITKPYSAASIREQLAQLLGGADA